jgi:predicted secreted Zn-dependent protease
MFRESLPLLILSFLCVTSTLAIAKDTSSITQYSVNGKTAAEVYEDIKAHAPRVAQNATFAFTMIATKTNKHETSTSNSCRFDRFKTSAIYNFVIPRHADPAIMTEKTRGKWANFLEYLKIHEQGHRTIWQNCLANYDAQSLALSATTCGALDASREALFTALKRKCLAEDEAYDVQFRKAVLNEPFVAQALRGK